MLNIEPFLIEIDQGYFQIVDMSSMVKLIGKKDIIFEKEYWKLMRDKYFFKLKKEFFIK